MKNILLCLVLISLSLQAATVRIYNKSNKPLRAALWYSDKGIPVTLFSFGIYREPKEFMNSQTIQPNSGAYFDSGLNEIKNIGFQPSGEDIVNFSTRIGPWEVERIIEFYNRGDIRRIR